MTEHTPGPWRIFPELSNRPVLVIGPVERVVRPGFVAQTVGGNDEANARLIAAAPALLEAAEAAEDIIAEVREYLASDYIDLLDDYAPMIRAAIAQAKGEALARP